MNLQDIKNKPYHLRTGTENAFVDQEQDYTFINQFLMGYCKSKLCRDFSQIEVERAERNCMFYTPGKIDYLRSVVYGLEEKKNKLALHQEWEARDRKKLEKLFEQKGFRFRKGYSFENLTQQDTFNVKQVVEPKRR